MVHKSLKTNIKIIFGETGSIVVLSVTTFLWKFYVPICPLTTPGVDITDRSCQVTFRRSVIVVSAREVN